MEAGVAALYWQGYLRIAQDRKLPLMLGRIERRLGRPLTLLGSQRRAGAEPLVHVRFTTPVEPPDLAQAVFQALLLARRLGRAPLIEGPAQRAGHWRFVAWSRRPSLPGLAYVQVEVSDQLWPPDPIGAPRYTDGRGL